MKFARPCLTCGILQRHGNRCQPCTAKIATKREQQRYGALGRSPYADPEWRKLSAAKRKATPYCESCGTTADLTVDHLIPLSQGGALIVPLHLLATRCRPCHGRVTKHAQPRGV